MMFDNRRHSCLRLPVHSSENISITIDVNGHRFSKDRLIEEGLSLWQRRYRFRPPASGTCGAPFVAALRQKTRGRMCPTYIAGLIGPGDRKSVQPMAARDRDVSYDRLHHFIASGVWDEAPLQTALLAEADGMVGGNDAWLMIDDTALPKKGAPIGWRGPTICLCARQERHLPDAGVADAGFGRSAGHGRFAAVPALFASAVSLPTQDMVFPRHFGRG